MRFAFLPMFIELAAVTMLLPDEMEEPSERERSPPSAASNPLPWALAAASIRFCFVGASALCKWRISHYRVLQGAATGWPTGNGKKLSNSQACCLALLCQAAA